MKKLYKEIYLDNIFLKIFINWENMNTYLIFDDGIEFTDMRTARSVGRAQWWSACPACMKLCIQSSA
jgi:hypothetical protein